MINIAYFRSRFPEFSDEQEFEDAIIQVFIDDAVEDVSQTLYKESIADRITAYLAAHYFYLSLKTEVGDSGSVAPIASQSEGEVSVSYGVNNVDKGSDAYFNSTQYGQFYLSLLKRYTATMVTI